MELADIIDPSAVKVPLAATDKQSAIFELVDLLAESSQVTNAARLKEVVWERESQRSTGIGEGLAIPHGKSTCSERIVVAVGRPPAPIEFGSVDKKPVQLIMLLASPPDRTADHIQALGKISRLMADAAVRDRAYAAETSDDLYRLLTS